MNFRIRKIEELNASVSAAAQKTCILFDKIIETDNKIERMVLAEIGLKISEDMHSNCEKLENMLADIENL